MPKNPTPFAADAALQRQRPKRSWRRGLRALMLVALGAAGGFWILEPPKHSPIETVAVIRRRPTARAGDDPSLAIEQIAGQILSPAQIGAALERTQPASRRSQPELAGSAESLRGRLRVDVDPGGSERPWTIKIRSTDERDPEQTAALVNALAEQYCQASQTAAVIRLERSYQEAQGAADQAQQAVKQAQQELDHRVDHFMRLAESARKKQAAAPQPLTPAAAVEAEEPPLRAEAARQLAELEAQRKSLLERLLPAHPDVQAIELEIEAAEARLSQFPPAAPEQPDGASPAKPPLDSDGEVDSLAREVAQAAAAIAEQRRLLSQAEDRARRLDAAERQMSGRLLLGAQDRVATIRSMASIASSGSKPSRQMTFAALAIALVMGWLAGRGRPNPPTAFYETSELEAATGVPVVAVLSAPSLSRFCAGGADF